MRGSVVIVAAAVVRMMMIDDWLFFHVQLTCHYYPLG